MDGKNKKTNKVSKYLFTDKNLIRNSALFVLVASACLLLASMMFMGNKTVQLVLYAFAIAIAGHELAIRGIEKLLAGKITADFIITIAILSVFAVNRFQEAVLITIIYSFGSVLAMLIRSSNYKKYRAAMGKNITVNVFDENGNVVEIDVSELKVKDEILVKSGETLLCDGEVVSDSNKIVRMMAGDVNKGEDIRVKVIMTYDCELNFEAFVEDNKKKSSLERIITAIMSYYTPIVVAGAFLTLAIPLAMGLPPRIWIYRAAIVLVLASPVSLASFIQTDFIFALANLKSKGITFGSSKQLELASKIKHIVLNKAGVITKGEYSVSEILTADGYTEAQVLAVAAMAQSGQDNAVAKAIKEAYNDKIIDAETNYIDGKGVVFDFNGKTVKCGSSKMMNENGIDISAFPVVSVYVAVDSVAIGAIKLSDTLKSDSVKAVKMLKAIGISGSIVTADNSLTAKTIAEKCDVSSVYALVDDQEKANIIKGIQKKSVCAFVGDSTTDGACFKAADVAFVMPADEKAENSINNQKLSTLVTSINESKRTLSVITVVSMLIILISVCILALGLLGKIPLWAVVMAELIFNCGCLFLSSFAPDEKSKTENPAQ